MIERPKARPARPYFSSGPCAKPPGWNLPSFNTDALGRSHRGAIGKTRLAEAIGTEPDGLVPGHAGDPQLRSIATARILGEAVVHGWDISMAAKRMWWIEPSDAALIFRSFLPFLPLFVHPENAKGVNARFDVRVRKFPEARAVFAFREGELVVEGEPQGRVDCVLSGAPASMILVIHRRIGLIRSRYRIPPSRPRGSMSRTLGATSETPETTSIR